MTNQTNKPEEPDDLIDNRNYTTGVLAAVSGLGRNTLTRYCEGKVFPAKRTPGGRYLVRGDVFKKFWRELDTIKTRRRRATTDKQLDASEERAMKEIERLAKA